MTVIRARLTRTTDYAFDDLTTADVASAFGSDGFLEVTLTPDVTDDVATAVRCRVISHGPDDEALRREIARLLDQPASPERTEALVVALARLAVLVP